MRVAFLACLFAALSATAQTSSAMDARVQAPSLAAPERGSLIGQFASTVFGPADVARGGFTLPAPFAVPQERGALLAPVFPVYNPEGGISEWGMGWQASMSISRYRVLGDPDYLTDELAGPWGRMLKGTDGYWYPVGLSHHVRVEWLGDTLTAWLSDGTRMTFGGTNRVVNQRGTFAWHLTEAVTPTGRKTRLAWQANSSGRLFLASASYGGTGENYQYRVDFTYEPISIAFTDYRSGFPLVLDQRVKQVAVLALSTASGLFEKRWHYDLRYTEEGFGPAFYLAQVAQVFSSGDAAPVVRYTYQLAKDHLGQVALVSSPKVAAVLSNFGSDALQPNRTAALDDELNGLQDLEHNTEYKLLRQTESGFSYEPLPPAPADIFARCRRNSSIYNPPRLIAHMLGDDIQHVVDFAVAAYGTSTTLSVCNRLGQKLGGQSLGGDWQSSANVRLVDLNRDRKPDLVRVMSGSYRVLLNTSTGSTFSYGPMSYGTLTPAFEPDTSWVHDFNGDGVADLIARSPSTLVVWFGKGAGQFVSQGQAFELRTSTLPISNLRDFALSFVDANKDGLKDVVLSSVSGNATYLFMNRGTHFLETVVPGLRSVDIYTSKPIVADLSGSGNTEVTFTRNGQGLLVALDRPGTGLMSSADDGKATVLSFEYARSPAAPGAHSRQVVLATLTVKSSGYDDVRYSYSYGQPTVHRVGKYLVGFGTVTRSAPGSVHEAKFLNGDTYAGLPSSSTQYDTRSPSVQTYEYRLYQDSLYQGVAWKRLKEEESGYSQQGGQVVGERVEYAAYEAEVCPSRMVRYTPHGTLTTETWRAPTSILPGHLHCLSGGMRLTGSHSDDSLNFSNEVRLTRNAAGLVQKVEAVSSTGDTLVLQEVVYRPDSLIDSISVPGRGTTRFVWRPYTLQLQKVTSPEGVVVEASQVHPLTDALSTLTTWRGSRSYSQSFAYDGMERLERQWDNLGGASSVKPNVRLAYKYATASQPGSITATTLVDAALNAFSTGVEWQTAAGEGVAKGGRIPEGWIVGGLTSRSRNLLETRTYARPYLSSAVDVTSVDYTTLFTNTNVVGVLSSSGLGFESTSLNRLHSDVQREVDTRLSLEGGWLKQEAVENAIHTTRRYLDAQKRLVAYDDEMGTRYTYTYDALGRLRSVVQPDGKRHRVNFDGHGRVSRVDRESIVSVSYAYQPGTGLLAKKTFLSPTGVAVREEAYGYDALGRKALDTHKDVASGNTQTYSYYYDGATPSAPTRADSPGFLTAVVGEGYTKLLEYRVDGKPTRKVLLLNGWHTVDAVLSYREDGSVRTEETCVRKPDGVLVSCTALANASDAYGRPDTVHLNGRLLADLTYNAEGQVISASLDGGNRLSFSYDSLTRAPAGFGLVTPSFTSSTSWRFNPRGLMENEVLGVGALTLTRTYGYSAQRFLTSSKDGQYSYGYGYDAAGLPSRIEENGVVRTLTQSGNTLTAGGVTYTFDALGRTVKRGELTLTYGPNGHVSRAILGIRAWDFLYDEAGQRLLKLKAGVPLPIASYLGNGGYLDSTGLSLPLKVGGQLAGVIQNNIFKPLAADMRGTVLSDYDGTPRLASPFGTRTSHPSSFAALDYVEKGYDADLGLIRMGVRDYDASINRFTTPDPLFLESPDRCAQSPSECNLYAYARGLPTIYADPGGRAAALVPVVLFFVLVPMTDEEAFKTAGVMFASVVQPHLTMAALLENGAAELSKGEYKDAFWSFTGALFTGAKPALSSWLGRTAASESVATSNAAKEGGLVTLYRGVNETNRGYSAALQGEASPAKAWWQFWKKSATPLEHNMGSTLNSPYTSWTTDPDVALNFALRGGGRGVVLETAVPRGSVISSPNLRSVYLIQNGRLVSESEMLLRDVVRGASATKVGGP